MNRLLLDPQQAFTLPEAVEEVLEKGVARSIAYNPWGTLLAAGCESGEIVIWDTETRGAARTCQPHTQTVTCLAWSRDGHLLVSGSLDGSVCLWRVLDNAQEARLSLDSPAVALSMDRWNPRQVIASLAQGPPVLLDFATGSMTPLSTVTAEADGRKGKGNNGAPSVLALFSRDAARIYVGQPRGVVSVLDRASCQFLDVTRVSPSAHITGLRLSRKGDRLLVNCSDKCARLVEATPPTELHAPFSAQEAALRLRTQKMGRVAGEGNNVAPDQAPPPLLAVVRSLANTAPDPEPWAAAELSHDVEHAALATSAHEVYMYDMMEGMLAKVLSLEGQNDALVDLAWHPGMNALCTLGASGRIYMWAAIYKEDWNAFAPDYTTLDCNQEYIEREDEFDANPRAPEQAKNGSAVNGVADEAAMKLTDPEEDDVDILGEDPNFREDPYLSDDSAAEAAGKPPPLRHLPIEVQLQAPATDPAEKKAASEAGDDMDEDSVSLSGSDDDQNDKEDEAGMQEQGSRAMGYEDPAEYAHENGGLAAAGGLGKRRRRPSRSLSYDGEPPDIPGLPQPAPKVRMETVGNYGNQHLQHHLPAGLDDLDIPSEFMGL